MASSPDNLGLPETGLPLLRDLIHERTGLFYENGRYETLSDRLAPLVVQRGFRSFLDFYYLLKYDADAPSEWRSILDVLSVQETYFWREIDQIEALVSQVVPELVRHDPGGIVRIWSVPCASGEEPLSIAIALSEAGWFDRARIEIHGSDGSAAAVAKARHGYYRERAFRALPIPLRDKYFLKEGDGWRPVPSLSQRIASWSVANLMSREDMRPHAGTPAIFCRNAFIYFSRQAMRAVVEAFADLMPRRGYLFVGASESLLSLTDRFALQEIQRAFVYVKV